MASPISKYILDPWREASPMRRKTVARWTFLGTLGCVAVSLLLNAIIFAGTDSDARFHATIGGTIVPIILAVPLFWFTSFKLRELAIANRKLEQLASTDNLTGCLNRGAFSSMVDNWLARQPAQSQRGALLVIDADHFKRINDRYGHDKGDVALRMIADCIGRVLRAGDLLGRMGGEEFAVFLPGASAENAVEIAERVRMKVSQASFFPADRAHALSVSIGAATFEAPVGFTQLFKFADEQLYAAKHDGRNRVSIGLVPVGAEAARPLLH